MVFPPPPIASFLLSLNSPLYKEVSSSIPPRKLTPSFFFVVPNFITSFHLRPRPGTSPLFPFFCSFLPFSPSSQVPFQLVPFGFCLLTGFFFFCLSLHLGFPPSRACCGIRSHSVRPWFLFFSFQKVFTPQLSPLPPHCSCEHYVNDTTPLLTQAPTVPCLWVCKHLSIPSLLIPPFVS